MRSFTIKKAFGCKRSAAALLLAVFLAGSAPAVSVSASANDDVAGADEMTTPEEVGREGLVPIKAADVPDGEYEVEVDSSSSMFRVVSATLTASEGQLTAELTMGGQGYLYVYPGTGEEAAAADDSDYIPFVPNEDGEHTFVVPVESLNEEFPLAAFSKKKEKWYDRQLLIYASPKMENKGLEPAKADADNGVYSIEVLLDGGSGKAGIESPAELSIKGGEATVKLKWSSPNYDYMYVNGQKYLPINEAGENSVFEIPVYAWDKWTDVLADTTAMSRPHEINYRIWLDTTTIQKTESASVPLFVVFTAALAVIVAAVLVITFCIRRKKKSTDKE